MARLEDLTVGANVTGLVGNTSVSVVAVKWHGTNAITVTFKNNACIGWVYQSIHGFPCSSIGNANQFDAQSDFGFRNIIISTAPPLL
ncbi:MAG: hypothetical protein FWB97_10120 [Oscillospiraceae bacterium]|nr:hypothetical protein [Oscillospiraceae bacterium]